MITRWLLMIVFITQLAVAQAPQLPTPPSPSRIPDTQPRAYPMLPPDPNLIHPSPCEVRYAGNGQPLYLRFFSPEGLSPDPQIGSGGESANASPVVWGLLNSSLQTIASGTLRVEDAISFNHDLSWKINVGAVPPGPHLFVASAVLNGHHIFCSQSLPTVTPPRIFRSVPGEAIGQGAPPPIAMVAGGAAPPEFQTVKIFFATDRATGPKIKEVQTFTGERSSNDALTFGTAEISIPRDHRMGELERQSLWRLDFRADPAKFVTLLRSGILPQDSFIAEIRDKLGADSDKQALIFIHGYNVTFEDAAMRLGQITYDLGFAGAPILYSWPSKGSTLKYTADEAAVEWTTAHFERFLHTVAEQTGAQTIYLVAHSMGNRALSGALRSMAEKGQTLKPQLKEIVMAAPDIDAGVFQQLAASIAQTGAHFTIYESSKDRALELSRRFHRSFRLGDSRPTAHAYEGYDCIDATAVDTGFLGHSYFAESTSILADLFDLIRGKSASDRFRLVKIPPGSAGCWTFRR